MKPLGVFLLPPEWDPSPSQGLIPWIKFVDTQFYYMAVSHKDWELPNSRIWLAEVDIDRGLDFPI